MLYHFMYMFAFLLSLLLIILLIRVKRSELGTLLLIMTGLTSFWLLLEGLSFFFQNEHTIILLQKFKYISIIYIPPTLLMTSYIFIKAKKTITPVMMITLLIIPVMTSFSITTGIFPYTFIANPSAHFEHSIPIFLYDKKIGFTIHTTYSYCIILFSNILLFYRAIKSPRLYKSQSIFVFIGSFTSMIINVIFISNMVGSMVVDTTPVSILISLYFFYWGVYSLPHNKLVPQARNLVIENMEDLIIIVDNTQKIIDVNPTGQQALNYMLTTQVSTPYSPITFIGIKVDKLLEMLDYSTAETTDILSGKTKEIIMVYNEVTQYYQISITPIIDTQNIQIGEVYLLHNITKLQENLNVLLELNDELTTSDTIINDALEAIVITDEHNKIIKVNHSMETMTGYTTEELIGNDPSLLKSDYHDFIFYRDMWDSILSAGSWEGEIWDRRKNGEVYPKWMSITVIKDDQRNIKRFIGISSDITKMKKAEADMHTLAYYDVLTGLPNRSLFNDRLTTALSRAKRTNKSLALLFIDLDRFKEINDTYGHAIGDEFLIAVSKRIKGRIRESDTLSRLGGDEFTLILEDLAKPEEVETVAKDILETLQQNFVIQNREISIMVSIGIALAPSDDTTHEGLIRKSDMAMYYAKELGGNQYAYSSKEIESKRLKVNKLGRMLKTAVQTSAFELYLQPQVALENGQPTLVGAEALIRWPQSDGTMIPPFEFIGIAEQNGLIHPIGLWVFEELIRMNHKLVAEGIILNLSLNVSIKQFENPDFLPKVIALMDQNKQCPLNLSIEITESLFFNDLEKGIRDLQILKDLGIKIALDDFGTGFSSMSYLNRLPLDYLKIDKSFIDEIVTDNPKNLAYMILSMAHMLDLQAVAEGIETKSQSDNLFDAGCDIIQGYYYSKPLPFNEFMTYAKEGFNNDKD